MKAILLAGGQGRRLRSITGNLPKPMVPLVGVPVLDRLLDLLRRNGFTDVCMTLCYRPEVIQEHCGDGSSYGVPLVGMTAAECGVEYADWYLNVAWSLIQQYKAQGQRLSVKDAIEMAKNGTVAYNEPAYGPFESIFAGMP